VSRDQSRPVRPKVVLVIVAIGLALGTVTALGRVGYASWQRDRHLDRLARAMARRDLPAAIGELRELAGSQWQEEERRALRGSLAALLSVTGEEAEARTILEDLLRERPDDPDLWKRLGTNALRAGDLDSAERYLAGSLRLDPHDVLAELSLATVHALRGNRAAFLAAATRVAERYAKRSPESIVDPTEALGVAHLLAIADLDVARARTYVERGRVLREAAAVRDPTDGAALDVVDGVVSYREGQFDRAVERLRSGVAKMPVSSSCATMAGVHYFLGLANRGLGQVEPMLDAFRRALECAPNGLWAAEVERSLGRAAS